MLFRSEFTQRQIDEHPQATLADAFGRGINGGQRIFERCTVIKDFSVLGMHDFESERSLAHFTEAANAGSSCQAFLLGAREIEEAQSEKPGAICDTTQHLPAASEDDFGQLHLAFDDGSMTREE